MLSRIQYMLTEDLLNRYVKKTSIINNTITLVVALMTTLFVCYGFYYKTDNTLSAHEQSIADSKAEINNLKTSVNNTAVFQGATSEQVKAIQDQISDIKSSQNRIEDKLDKILLKID